MGKLPLFVLKELILFFHKTNLVSQVVLDTLNHLLELTVIIMDSRGQSFSMHYAFFYVNKSSVFSYSGQVSGGGGGFCRTGPPFSVCV